MFFAVSAVILGVIASGQSGGGIGTTGAEETRLVLSAEYCAEARQAGRRRDPPVIVDDDAPYPLFRQLPKWPLPGIREEGFAIMEYDIGPDGRPSNIRVFETSHEALGKEGARTVAEWRYCPVYKDGKPVTSRNLRTRLEFKFEESGEESGQAEGRGTE